MTVCVADTGIPSLVAKSWKEALPADTHAKPSIWNPTVGKLLSGMILSLIVEATRAPTRIAPRNSQTAAAKIACLNERERDETLIFVSGVNLAVM